MSQPTQLAVIIGSFLLVFIVLRVITKTLSLTFKIILALIIAGLITAWLLYRTPILF